jgi:hypothetical protein
MVLMEKDRDGVNFRIPSSVWNFATECLYEILIFPMRAICLAHLTFTFSTV